MAATSNLDVSLDDIIKSNKTSGRSGAKRNRKGRGSAIRNAPNRLGTRPTPYTIGKPPRRNQQQDGAWQHDLFEDGGTGGKKPLGIETGTKLKIKNLDHGVSTDDIKELFSEIGDLKRCNVKYDKSGRSKGVADVVFARKVDALKAIKRYNNVQLDGKPMAIKLVGTNLVTKFADVQNSGPSARGVGGGGARGRIGKRLRRKPMGNNGKGRGKAGPPKSAEELDQDLDNYHAEAMQT